MFGYESMVGFNILTDLKACMQYVADVSAFKDSIPISVGVA